MKPQPFDYHALNNLRSHHPGWRLLRSDHAPLIISFLDQAFVQPNQRTISESALVEQLEDVLYELRLQLGEGAFPKAARLYLNDWAAPDKGWLRKFYRQDSDEAQFDLTPACEKAIAWLKTLTARSFVGTESRLLTLFELLRQMSTGAETDPEKRLADLQQRRVAIDLEIAQIEAGDLPMLDDTEIKDRFQQFNQLARELLGDFREVEHNFRQLDRRVREQIALWEGSKGELLQQVMGDRDAIADSDQGKSFRAFWDFLMSSRRQEELSELLEQVLTLQAVQQLKPDTRTRKIHYDWLEAGEHTQRTVAQLSQQLRRFLDDQAWLENKRIMEILQGIESKALAIRQTPPKGMFFELDEQTASIELPMERSLYKPSIKPVINSIQLQQGDEALDASALYAQTVIDKTRLIRHIRQALQNRSQISLQLLLDAQPLQQGLAELIAYLQLDNQEFQLVIDEANEENIHWQAENSKGEPVQKQATLPRVIYVRA